MVQNNDTQPFSAWVVRQEGRCTPELELIGEEPFLIRVEDHAYSVVMRTPGDEVCHAMGFCLGEGLVDTPADIRTIGYDRDLDPNVVDIWLTPERRRKVASLLQRKTFISQTSCGICGKEMMKDIQTRVKPAPDGFAFTLEQALYCIELLSSSQKYRQRTRGSHAAMLCDENLSILGFAEDVGRHNGLDKAVGQAFQARSLGRARILVLSSRISYELVQKAARARLPVIIANSRPTALAARMGSSLNMTLSFPTGEDHLMVVCGEERLVDT